MLDHIVAALDGRAVLLVGSGFTFGAQNEDNKRIPTVDDLLDFFNKPYVDHFKNYRNASDRFINDPKHGSALTFAALKRSFSVRAFSESHKNLLSAPWKRIYTTNFDNLIERTLSSQGINFRSLNAAKDIRAYDQDRVNVIHLNGMFDNLDNINFDALIRLTDSSYVADRFKSSRYYQNLRHEIRTASAIFIVGYSIPDLDIAQILYSEAESRSKTIIVIKPGSEEEEIYPLRKFGSVFQIGIDGLSEQLNISRKNYIPRTVFDKLYSLQETILPDLPADAHAISDRDRFDLYIYGSFKPDQFVSQDYSKRGGYYSVERTAVSRTLEVIRKTPHLCIAHGDLASGKTVFTQQLALRAAAAGFRVFSLEKSSEFNIEEIEHVISRSSYKTVIIIENYERFQAEIRYLLEQYRPNLSIVITARSLVHQSSKFVIHQSNRQNIPVFEINLNRLDREERGSLVKVLLTEELKGAFKITTEQGVDRVISDVCKDHIREVLLILFRSEHIQRRLRDQFTQASIQSHERRYLLISFIIRVLAVNITFYEMEDAFFSKDSYYNGFLARDDIKEIIRFDQSGVSSVSPAMSQFFIWEFYSPREVRNALIDICKRSYELDHIESFNELYKVSIQNGKIRDLFRDADANDELLVFYDSAVNLSVVKDNPYFWLQYGIARWAKRERDLTDSCISAARRAGKQQPNFNAFQIDTFEATVRLSDHKAGNPGVSYKEDIDFAINVAYRHLNDERTNRYPLTTIADVCKSIKSNKININQKQALNLISSLRRMEKALVSSEKYIDYSRDSTLAEREILETIRILNSGVSK